METNKISDEMFSDDWNENLKIENELLKIKLQAQSGASFESNHPIPPQIENVFLRQVEQFEEAFQNAKSVKLYELLGRPPFRKAGELAPAEIRSELAKVSKLMAEKNIYLDTIGKYEPLTIYKFITEELFNEETENISLPGLIKNFIYEEFHPNHELDLKFITEHFIDRWFRKSFDEDDQLLSAGLSLPDATTLTRKQAVNKLQSFFDCYHDFSKGEYVISEIKFQFDDEGKGLGHVEGTIKYNAELEKAEIVSISGPFKLYFSNEDNFWSIFYFVFPGFAW